MFVIRRNLMRSSLCRVIFTFIVGLVAANLPATAVALQELPNESELPGRPLDVAQLPDESTLPTRPLPIIELPQLPNESALPPTQSPQIAEDGQPQQGGIDEGNPRATGNDLTDLAPDDDLEFNNDRPWLRLELGGPTGPIRAIQFSSDSKSLFPAATINHYTFGRGLNGRTVRERDGSINNR